MLSVDARMLVWSLMCRESVLRLMISLGMINLTKEEHYYPNDQPVFLLASLFGLARFDIDALQTQHQ